MDLDVEEPEKRPKKQPQQSKASASAHKKASVWVKLFVAFHVFAITVWAIPTAGTTETNKPWKIQTSSIPSLASSLNLGVRLFNQNELKTSPAKFYLLSTGFWQYWDMFAPDPARTDTWVNATVKYKDGSTKVYQYPRIYKLDYIHKYFEERYRKFLERANDDSYQYLWPRFSQRIAEMMDTKPNDPPVEVILVRHWKEVQPPGKPQLKAYNSYTFFRYVVDQNDLNQFRERGWLNGSS